MKKLRVFEAFAGYGSQHIALKRLSENFPQFQFEVVGISEIDKHAIAAYHALHGDIPNFGDIAKINWGGGQIPDFDMFTYSFPCTDISNAGLQKGFEEGSNTRSSLLWECKKAIAAKRPKYLLMENVKAIIQKKFKPHFQAWQDWLVEQGYVNFCEVLNAKDFGVPQNRERVFLVSILTDGDTATYKFPFKIPLEKRLKDILEENVDEIFYLKDEQVRRIVTHCDRKVAEGCGFKTNFVSKDDISGTIKAKEGQREYDTYYKELPPPRTICLNYFDEHGAKRKLQNRIYSTDGNATAITTRFMPNFLVLNHNGQTYNKNNREKPDTK